MNLSDDAVQALPGLILGFALAALVTLLATPFVRRYALRSRVVDRPEARRVNTRIVARGGGVALGFGFVSVSRVMLGLNSVAGLHFADEPAVVGARQVVALLGGAVLAVAIGFLDDRVQLRARWQFVGQFALAGGGLGPGGFGNLRHVPL